MDSMATSASRIIYWIQRGDTSSMKEYKYWKVLEKIDWNIFFNNIIRYELDMMFFTYFSV